VVRRDEMRRVTLFLSWCAWCMCVTHTHDVCVSQHCTMYVCDTWCMCVTQLHDISVWHHPFICDSTHPYMGYFLLSFVRHATFFKQQNTRTMCDTTLTYACDSVSVHVPWLMHYGIYAHVYAAIHTHTHTHTHTRIHTHDSSIMVHMCIKEWVVTREHAGSVSAHVSQLIQYGIYAHLYAAIHTHTRARAHTHTHTHTQVIHYVIFAHVYAAIHIHTYTHTHTLARAHTHTHMCTHTHTHDAFIMVYMRIYMPQ